MADTHRRQPVFFPHKGTSKNIRMMQQREQVGAEKNGVSLVTYIAYTTRSMPSTILVSCSSAGAHELPSGLGFHCSLLVALKRVGTHFRI
jgi:hypothetical protein